MDTNTFMPYEATPNFYQRNRNLFKGFFISFLILALLIPTFFISNLIDERKERNKEVKESIANQWSNEQTLIGPILVIPFYDGSIENNNSMPNRSHAYFMPDKLTMNGKLLPEIRKRSIFKVPVYNSVFDISGSFKALNLPSLQIPVDRYILSEAKLVFGVYDAKGIQEETMITWDKVEKGFNIGQGLGVLCQSDEENLPVEYRSGPTTLGKQALVTEIPLTIADVNTTHTFQMKLNLRGTERIFFTPIGMSTKVSVKANWKDRDFQGNYLPESHQLSDTGFVANWNIYRATQAQFKHNVIELSRTTFGVNLIQPLDNYAKTSRTIKYAILVIMLTFVVYFFIELFQKRYVHAIQYVLIGFALCIFYTLVLSISEYLGFPSAYIISALATILLITLYTRSVFGNNKSALVFASFLGILYSFIFVLIQLEDGSLLIGSIGLFIILASIMFVSRKLDWNKS